MDPNVLYNCNMTNEDFVGFAKFYGAAWKSLRVWLPSDFFVVAGSTVAFTLAIVVETLFITKVNTNLKKKGFLEISN